MNTRIAFSRGTIAMLLVAAMAYAQAGNLKDIEITDEFPIDRCAVSVGLVTDCMGAYCNAYLPLIVGRVWELDNAECDDCEELEAVTISILDDVETVDDQPVRVLEEREWVDGELEEVSRNFVNMCPNTQDVFYFGEDVCLDPDDEDAQGTPPYPDHFDCTTEGLAYGPDGWRAGIGESEPGLLFPGGTFLLGAAYFQEMAPEIALDWAMNSELGLTYGNFVDCVLVLDRNLMEDPKSKEEGDEKVYCPDIGIVQDEELELTSCTDAGGACTQ